MNLNHSEPLTCPMALERLDAIGFEPLPIEPLTAEAAAAWEHARECSTCWVKVKSLREADDRIAVAMQDVSIPLGLKERLLAQVTANETCHPSLHGQGDPQPSVIRSIPNRSSNSRSLKLRFAAVVSAAALLVCASIGSVAWFAMQPSLVSLQTLCDQTPIRPDSLLVVQDFSAFPKLPDSWRSLKNLAAWEKLRSIPLGEDGLPGLWVPFEIKLAKQTIRGVLLATQKANVSNPPAELFVSATRLGYTTRDGRPVAVAGWTEHGVVYVCFIPGETSSLERLLKATAPTSA